MNGVHTHLKVRMDATKFCKPRTVPYAVKEAIEQDLARLERQGIIERVSTGDWATPVVPVSKSNGSVCLCGDYRVTVNPVLELDHYPMPTRMISLQHWLVAQFSAKLTWPRLITRYS